MNQACADSCLSILEITNVANYCSRMGLGFSTSNSTVTVRNYDIVSDEVTQDGTYTFSDGCGLIAKSLAERV